MTRLRLALRLLRLAAVLGEGAAYAAWVGLRDRRGGAPMALRQRLTRRFMARLQAALPFEVRVRGALPAQPALWLANHVSWVDIAVLGALQPLSFLAKAEVALLEPIASAGLGRSELARRAHAAIAAVVAEPPQAPSPALAA